MEQHRAIDKRGNWWRGVTAGLLRGDSQDADVIETGMPLTTSSVPKGTRQLVEEKGEDQMGSLNQ